MELAEKRKKIEEHCIAFIGKEGDCADCPLYEVVIKSNGLCYIQGANIERNYDILFGNGKDQNPYWQRICKLSDKQRAKGIETYGQGLEANPADMLKRIEHLQEELIDALMYCEWIKDKLTELEGKA